MKETVLQTTLKHNQCISCGLCQVSCPKHAITMKLNKYNEPQPVIDKTKCINCGICTQVCPNTIKKYTDLAELLSKHDAPHTYGLENASYFLAWDPDEEQRIKSCSGGVVTKLACYLLKTQKIDGMVHAKRILSKRNELHYEVCLSKTEEEIRENGSSCYQCLNFSKILNSLEEGKTYFITGTPCVIRGLKKLSLNKKIKFITCGLICSHNVNPQFADYLADKMNVPQNQSFKLNMRYKDKSIPDANNFKGRFYDSKGTIVEKNRFESGWTDIWRSYYFAMGACLKCPDFWAYEADISVKDAWGPWAEDPLGKSIVIIRNPSLIDVFAKSGLVSEALDWEVMKDHQKPTAEYKQTYSWSKMKRSIFIRKNRKKGIFEYTIISNSSKFLYKHFGYRITSILMKIIKFFAVKGKKL